MDKLKLIDELNEMELSCGPDVLEDLRQTVETALQLEIFRDITDLDMSYCGPEYDSWQTFLSDCRDDGDYRKVLTSCFDQEGLDRLWHSSHIAGDMTDAQIGAGLVFQFRQLKLLKAMLGEPGGSCDNVMNAIYLTLARIVGLYHILNE